MKLFFLFMLIVALQIKAESEDTLQKIEQKAEKSADVASVRQKRSYELKKKQHKTRLSGSLGSQDVKTLGGIRLIDEDGYPSRRGGRVEVFMNGQWGTVCDDETDNDTAKVVCRQLNGHVTHSARTFDGYGRHSFFKNRPFPIWMDEVDCAGTERSIFLCKSSPFEHDCGHGEDLIVGCARDYAPIRPSSSRHHWRPSARYSDEYRPSSRYDWHHHIYPSASDDYYPRYTPDYSRYDYSDYNYQPSSRYDWQHHIYPSSSDDYYPRYTPDYGHYEYSSDYYPVYHSDDGRGGYSGGYRTPEIYATPAYGHSDDGGGMYSGGYRTPEIYATPAYNHYESSAYA